MNPLIRTARITGLLYLGLAVVGALGFLIVRNQLFVAGDATATLANLMGREALARAGVALELGIVVTQALVALWFYRLFRSVDAFAAGALAGFGMVNAVAILGSAAFLATALEVALEHSIAPAGDASASVQLMYVLSGNLWGVGKAFFGLWLIPMGRLVLRSGWMPRPMGWILVVGGVGYLLSAVVSYLVSGGQMIADALTLPATVGEFWMIGYLLVFGVRRGAVAGKGSE